MPRDADQRIREFRHALRGPMAVDPRWLDQVVPALARNDLEALQALSFDWGSAVSSAEIEDGIGRIAIRGPLLEGMFFTDYSDIRKAFETFMDSAEAQAVVLDIDSPGGVVAGAMWTLAETIRERRDEKTVVAVANEQATSAAYLIASQASEVFAGSRGAVLGSIGVIASHVDHSKRLAQAGIQVTEVVSGRLKNILSRNKPLSREGRQFLEQLVEVAFLDFIEAVNEGRGLSESAIRDLEGGIVLGQDAVDQNLADGVRSLEEIMVGLAQRSPMRLVVSTQPPRETHRRNPMGQRLASRLNGAIDAMVTDDRSRSDIIEDMASAGGIDSGTVTKILNASLEVPPLPRLKGFAQALEGVTFSALQSAAEEDGCSYEEDEEARAPAVGSEAGTVVPIEAARTEGVAAGKAEERKRGSAIRQLCTLAGCPERFGEFIAQGMTPQKVGELILKERAESGGLEIQGQHNGGGVDGAGMPKFDHNAIYQKWGRNPSA